MSDDQRKAYQMRIFGFIWELFTQYPDKVHSWIGAALKHERPQNLDPEETERALELMKFLIPDDPTSQRAAKVLRIASKFLRMTLKKTAGVQQIPFHLGRFSVVGDVRIIDQAIFWNFHSENDSSEEDFQACVLEMQRDPISKKHIDEILKDKTVRSLFYSEYSQPEITPPEEITPTVEA